MNNKKHRSMINVSHFLLLLFIEDDLLQGGEKCDVNNVIVYSCLPVLEFLLFSIV